MGDSDEEDYMSSKFLEEAANYEQQSQKEKPYSERRKQQIREQQAKAYIKPRAQLEREAREEGLKRSVDESNKGMKMLMKMGFKQGMTLGKSGGLEQPIPLEMKTGRGGLGMESSRKRELEEREKEEAEKRQKMDPEGFREQMAERSKKAKLGRRIAAAAALCERFDKENGIEANVLWTLIPKREEETATDSEQNETESDTSQEQPQYPSEEVKELHSLQFDEQLKRLVDYLRSKYTYCFWCGAKFNDEQDLLENCPGPEEDDH